MSELPKVNVEIEEYWYRKCPCCHHIDDAPFTEASPMEPVEVRCSFCHRPYVLTYHRTAYDDLQREVETLRRELSEQMQLKCSYMNMCEKLAEALKGMKGAMWCENIDDQNCAYDLATEVLAEWTQLKETMK